MGFTYNSNKNYNRCDNMYKHEIKLNLIYFFLNVIFFGLGFASALLFGILYEVIR